MWETIEARICALRKDGLHRLLSMRVFLTAEETDSGRTLVEHPGLDVAMWIEKVSARYLDELLRQLRDEKTLTIGRRSLTLEVFENSPWRCERYSGRYRGYLSLEYPYVLLHADGKSFHEVADWSDLDKQLHRHGYSDLAGTSQENLAFPVGSSYSTQIAIAAPIYLNFKSVEAQGNTIRVSVESHTCVPLKDITLSYEVKYEQEGKVKTLNETANLDESDVAECVGRFQILRKEITANGRIAEARIWLYGKWTTEPIDSTWVRQEAVLQESVAWRTLAPLLEERHRTEVIDGHRKLREYLCIDYVDPTLGRQFELAVSHLLGSMGFSVFFVGQPLPKKGIDVVAVCPDSGRTLIVSTHVSNDIHDKLRTLLPEYHRLKDALQGVQLTPVLFSPASADDILTSDRIDAKAHSVALVLGSRIGELFSIAGNMKPAEARQRTLELIDRVLKEQSQR
jgi:hypothetical protein